MELIRYQNAEGASFSTANAKTARHDAHKAPLRTGENVAIKHSHVHFKGVQGRGWDTPFYLARIMELISGDDGVVTEVIIQWMAPFERDDMSNNVNKPWALLCHGQHRWVPICDVRNPCAGGKWTQRIEVAAIGATDLSFIGTGVLSANSMKALVRASPNLCKAGTELTYEKGGKFKVTLDAVAHARTPSL